MAYAAGLTRVYLLPAGVALVGVWRADVGGKLWEPPLMWEDSTASGEDETAVPVEQGPVVRPMENVFHPNIVAEGVYLSVPWQPGDTLTDYIVKVGELLAFRNWDANYVANQVAMDWIAQNGDALPVDAQADLSPYAG